MLYTSRSYYRSIARVLHGQIMMMKVRGYKLYKNSFALTDDEVLNREDLDSSLPFERIGLEDKTAFLRSDLNAIYRHKDNKKNIIHIYYVNDTVDKNNELKPSTNLVKNSIQEYISENKVKHIIIISSKAFPAKNLLDPLDSVIYEYFEDKQLLVVPNETIHYTPPQLLTVDEGKRLLDSYKVTHTQLPRILFNDPLVRFWGWGNVDDTSSYMNRILRFDHPTPFKTIVDGFTYYRVISPVLF